ncbi:MAG: hypothetical protein Q7T47_02065, partial [Anaerolineales bacterium]|nr:hypothetical protein [Anaerolineales bacterium]
CLRDDFRCLAGAQQGAGNTSIEGDTFRQPPVRQRLRLGAALLGQWKVSLALEAVFGIANRFAVAEEEDVIVECGRSDMSDFNPMPVTQNLERKRNLGLFLRL